MTTAPRGLGYYMRRLGPAAPLAVVASTLPPLGSIVLFWYIESISHWLRGHAAEGPAIYAGCFVVLGALAVLPTYAYAALGGWAFGFARGFPAAMAGFVGAALLAYGIGRAAAGDRVVKLIEENPKWRAVYEELLRGGFWKTLAIVTLLRLPPNSPFAVANLVFSFARVPVVIYCIGTLIGLAPRTGLVLWFASRFGDVDSNEPRWMLWRMATTVAVGAPIDLHLREPRWVLWVGIAIAVLVVIVIGQMAQRALERVVPGSAKNEAVSTERDSAARE